MIRRSMLAVVATAAISINAASATAQSSASQIQALRSESDDPSVGLSEYTMLYWIQALHAFGDGPYTRFSQNPGDEQMASLPDDFASLAWAPLMRTRSSATINAADDPTLPDNAWFFNPSTLTTAAAAAAPVPMYAAWIPRATVTESSDDSPASVAPSFQPIVAPAASLPGADAWSSEPAVKDASGDDVHFVDESSTDSSRILESAFAPIDAPSLVIVATPEPGTLALFATGFAALIGAGVKRKKSVA